MDEYYEDVFFKIEDKEYCNDGKALSILLAESILFANSRHYIEWDKWVPDESRLGKYKHLDTYKVQDETVVLFVNCNDLFWWACADAESITLDEIPTLFRAWRNDKSWGVSKW